MKFSKLSSIVILAVLAVGFSSAYAVITITLAGNVLVTGDMDVSGAITGPTISNLDSRVTDLENTFLNPTPNCSGSAGCIPGYVTENIDGDTLKVYGKSIRLTLVDAPETGEPGFEVARDFIANACPPGSLVIVDEDDLQTGGTFGRIIGVVYCDGVNLNDAILTAGLADLFISFCTSSEFENTPWAQFHGC